MSIRMFAVVLASLFLLVPIFQTASLAPTLAGPAQQYASIPDFTLSTSPSFLALAEGTTGSLSIILTSQAGFSGNIVLDASSFFDISLDKTSIQLASGQSASATLTILAATSTAPGNYTTIIKASSGCILSHTARITVEVIGPDFTIAAEKTHLTAAPGGSDSSKIDLASRDGFADSIALYSFSLDLGPTLNPASHCS